MQGSASPTTFSFGADDGGLLFVNGSQLIDNHGEPMVAPPAESSGGQGQHDLDYLQHA